MKITVDKLKLDSIKIAYVKVFNRALTAEEIATEYNTMFNNEIQIYESGVLYTKDLKQY